MKRATRRAVALSMALGVLSPALARADFDPNAADSDVTSILKSSDYQFCEKPHFPLSPRARALCPLAGEIPGCSTLVTECSTHEEEPELGAFWKRLFAAIVKALPYVAWTLIAVVVVSVLTLVFRAIRKATTDRDRLGKERSLGTVTLVEDESAPPDLSASLELFERGRAAAGRGDYRDALRLYLAAALRALDERGALRISPDTTNGEYLRACREESARPPLRDLVRGVDRVEFGGDDATADAVAVAEARASVVIRTPAAPSSPSLPTMLTMLTLAFAAMCLVSCGGAGGHSRDDPAAKDLIVELLEKQGAKVIPLPGSLAHLPLGEKGPVIVLDAETVPLEDKTKEHLVAWVQQGGTLVIAGNPSGWPSELWAKATATELPDEPTRVDVKTRSGASDDSPKAHREPAPLRHARIAHPAVMTWPSEDRAPPVVAELSDGGLYGALRDFGDGRILGLASDDLLTNAGLAVPGNAAALVAMLGTLGEQSFSVVRFEQGIAPPSNPFAGLLAIGLGPALLQALFLALLLFLAYGVRQVAPRPVAPPRRRAFAEHVEAVGALYARRRAARHALAVFAKFIDERLRARMPAGSDPATFLASRAGTDVHETTRLYTRALEDAEGARPRESFKALHDLSRLCDAAQRRG